MDDGVRFRHLFHSTPKRDILMFLGIGQYTLRWSFQSPSDAYGIRLVQCARWRWLFEGEIYISDLDLDFDCWFEVDSYDKALELGQLAANLSKTSNQKT